jgi:hypothetical protein
MARIQVLRQMLVVGLKIQIEKTFGKSEDGQKTTSMVASESACGGACLRRMGLIDLGNLNL